MRPANPLHRRSVTCGDEDGRPVYVALVRVRLYSFDFEGAREAPHDVVLSWWNGSTCTVARELDDTDTGWAPVEPDIGMVGHDITWHTGHVSTSAVVADIYLADGSVLLAVTTSATAQRFNETARLSSTIHLNDPS